jgi:hypothetical protein
MHRATRGARLLGCSWSASSSFALMRVHVEDDLLHHAGEWKRLSAYRVDNEPIAR